MVSKTTLKGYEFSTIEEYYDYILESKLNGQPQQVKQLFLKLSKDQRRDFLSHLADCLNNEHMRTFDKGTYYDTQKLLIEVI